MNTVLTCPKAIISAALISGILIPAWILPQGERSLSASGFFMQFFVQGAWGVIPIHLNELSPPAFRSTFPGITYQLGNMISSPSAQIVNAIAESHLITGAKETPTHPDPQPSYGPTMGIATAIIALGIAVTAAFGPEKRGRHFEKALPAGVVLTEPKDLETGQMHEKSLDERSSQDEKRLEEKTRDIETIEASKH